MGIARFAEPSEPKCVRAHVSRRLGDGADRAAFPPCSGEQPHPAYLRAAD